MKCRFNISFSVILSVVLIFSTTSLFAQYSADDYNLVKTVYQGAFDKSILRKYLYSQKPDSVIAGLLAVSHSEDTSWVNEIVNLDFNSYGKFISFALGQVGVCKQSEQFLIQKISGSNHSSTISSCYEALGKICGDSTIENLLSKIENGNLSHVGFPLAITNYFLRSGKVSRISTIGFLTQQIRNPQNDIQDRIDAIYCLYRIGPDTLTKELLVTTLKENLINNSDEMIIYSLGCLRKLKYFPPDLELFTALLIHNSWNVRCEAAKTLCYFESEEVEVLKQYLNLISDSNPNVSRQAAISLREIEPTNEQKKYLEYFFNKSITCSEFSANTNGELFISYCEMFKENVYKIIDEYENQIDTKFILRELANENPNPENKFERLAKYLSGKQGEVFFLDYVPALLSLQPALNNNEKYSSLVLSLLNSEFPSTISITAEGLDSNFVSLYSQQLMQLILEQTVKYVNNPQFAESLISLANLAERINSAFKENIIGILSTSSLNSIQRFVSSLNGELLPTKKDGAIFEEIWNNAFLFSKASVETNKGTFLVEFFPAFAPLSCGNFCYLSQKGFYKNVSFHRVVPNFVIQAGDTSGTGWGGPGYEIISEYSPLKFEKGSMGMASSGKNTEGSQWFVMHNRFPHLDSRYTVFGKVIEGENIVDIIDQDDVIINITPIR